jgi:hypothetical protein
MLRGSVFSGHEQWAGIDIGGEYDKDLHSAVAASCGFGGC